MKKNIFSDSHCHLSHVQSIDFLSQDYFCCSSFHSKQEFEESGDFENVIKSFGVHPQNPQSNLLEYVEELAVNGKIKAVGECGFDLFTPEYKSMIENQIICFDRQLEIAVEYQLPLVLHIRKAMHLVFERIKMLKKVPAIIFHAYPGTLLEARSLLSKNLNCFFSFGKPLLNGKKSALECVQHLPLDRILLETDAPYQTLKDEKFTELCDIVKVYQKAGELRNVSLESLKEMFFENFTQAFLVH